jgi:hypothetical protein
VVENDESALGLVINTLVRQVFAELGEGNKLRGVVDLDGRPRGPLVICFCYHCLMLLSLGFRVRLEAQDILGLSVCESVGEVQLLAVRAAQD